MKQFKKVVIMLVLAGAALFVLVQLVPVRRENPPVVSPQVRWDSPQTQALFERACSDCHSNQTVWPWYSYVAPVSWLVAHDVNEGREKFNISDLNGMSNRKITKLPEEVEEVVDEGEMPMGIYIVMHPSASLNSEEKKQLVNGLVKTIQDTLAAR